MHDAESARTVSYDLLYTILVGRRPRNAADAEKQAKTIEWLSERPRYIANDYSTRTLADYACAPEQRMDVFGREWMELSKADTWLSEFSGERKVDSKWVQPIDEPPVHFRVARVPRWRLWTSGLLSAKPPAAWAEAPWY